MTAPDASVAADDGRAAPYALQRGELGLILAFWVVLGALMAGSRLFDPRGPGVDSPVAIAFATMVMAQSLLWAAFTPLLFVAASRLDPERGDRLAGVALLVALAIGAALVVHVAGDFVRDELLPRGAGGGGGGRGGRGGRGGGGPFRISLVNDLITAGGVLAAAIARDASRRYRAREAQATRLQGQLAEARLDALRRQLDPHFLFNTLNAVSALVERDPRGVRRMIARLSDLLRHSMDGDGAAEIPLERELALLQLYVDIMMVRFQGRLEVRTAVDPAARTALVPQLVLQPLVENAIRHGVSQVDGAGHIVVEAEVTGDALVLRVRDDGRGLAEGATATTGGGVGLRNTRARLAQLYGEAQRFTLQPAPGGGTVAELTIPFRPAATPASGDTPS